MDDKLREDVVSQIRACLISTKGARDLRQLRSDYLMLMGCEIPYGKLGYKSLELFIRSVPTLKITQENGQLFVNAVATEQSAHIAKFVEKQKTKRRTKPAPRQTNNRRPVVPPRWRPRNVTANWNKSYDNQRSATYAHTQVVSSPKSPAKKPSIKDRLGPKVVSNNYEELTQSSRFTVQSLKEALNNTDYQDKQEEITLSKQRKMRLWEKEIAPEGTVSNNLTPLSPVVSPFPPDFLSWNVPEVPKVNMTENLSSEVRIQTVSSLQMNFTRTDDHWGDLNLFVLKHHLGEISCKTIQKQRGRRSILYYCTIQIGDKKYTNYPSDNFTEESAKQEASKKALDDLEEFCQSQPQQGLLLSDMQDVLKRVPPMVKTRQCGVWSSLIEAEYIAQYSEQLPLNWIEMLNTLPYIAVHQINDKYVLNYCEPSEKTNSSNPQSHNVSVIPNTVSFNDVGFLVAEITCINSAAEMWCSQRETPDSDIFSAMVSEMEAYYIRNGHYELASTVQMGGHYVACYDGLWCRVRVFEVKDDDIHCFCIDFGDEWIIKKDALYNLKTEFAGVQAQAFVCRLAGLEELYEVSKSSEHLQSYLGKIVQVQQEINGDESETDPSDPTLSVVLYDLETDKPINEEIITYIGLEVASPSLVVNTPTEVYVSHVLDDGSVYIQLRSIGYEQLMSLIEKVGQNILDNKISVNPVKVSKSREDELYFVQNKEDGRWYRVKIIDWSPNNKHAQLLHVDNGKSTVVEVEKTDFYILRDISDVISKFPLQGVRVKLQLKSIPSNFVERMKDLMPYTEPVIVKLIKVDADYVHIVEFFKMSKTDDILFSINLSIAPDNNFKNTIGDGNNNKAQSVKLQRLISLNQFEDTSYKMPSAGLLSSPHIPEVGQYFDVKISYAVHPHSFFVQPYESVEKLNSLMAEMQEAFKDTRQSSLQLKDISPGKVYVSKYEDGKWYRTSVIRVVHSGSISVFYSDFGYYGSVNYTQLFPLGDKFMRLPYQAIKAKLDVQPKKAKWCFDDCDYFKNLVNQKCFVSVLRGIEKDMLCPGDIILTLNLIDTSQSDTDVDIDDVLVAAGKAIIN